MNLKKPEKIQLMLAILAFLYALIQKDHLINAKNIKEKKYKHGSSKAISIFRNSYDDFKLKILIIKHLVKLICTFLKKYNPPDNDIFKDCIYLSLKSVQ